MLPDLKNVVGMTGSILWWSGQIAKVSSEHPSVRRSTGVDTNMIVQSRKGAARLRHCNGTAHSRRAVNSVTDEHELRRSAEALRTSKVTSQTPSAHVLKARRAHERRSSSVE